MANLQQVSLCRADLLEPGHGRTRQLRAHLSFRSGDVQSALEDLTVAQTLIPDSPEVHSC